MKKMMINSAMALALALGNSFGGLLGVATPSLKTRNRGKGRGRRLGQWNLYLKTSRPTDKRHWHNLNDQAQRDALQAADAKRERKAEKLTEWAHSSRINNNAHDHRDNLNPLYVNRGEVV